MKKLLLYYLLNFTFLISIVYSASDIILPKIDNNHDKNVSLKKLSAKEGLNKTTLIISEGGSLVPNTLPSNLKDNETINLLSLDEEMPKTKEKPVHARKGVEGTPDNTIPIQKNSSSNEHNNLTTKNITKNLNINNKTNQLTSPNITTATKENTKASTVPVKATTLPVKKPLILSYEAISRLDDSNNQAKMPAMKSSFESIVHDQIPSPNKDSNVKSELTVGTKDPGMVTPIVITILVVPMFAVLGYMALRRGQEAWKNRHYKRMDFLLDGMYND